MKKHFALWAVAFAFGVSMASVAQSEEAAGVKPVQLPGVTAAAESPADKVFITGQPNKETLEVLSQKGVKTVINLRRVEEMTKLDFDEATTAKTLGMTYLNVPMNTGLPKTEDLNKVLDVLAGAKTSPVLLHCASGNRAGAIWAVYSGVRKGQTPDAAIAEGKAAGLKNEALEHVVRNRIVEAQK